MKFWEKKDERKGRQIKLGAMGGASEASMTFHFESPRVLVGWSD